MLQTLTKTHIHTHGGGELIRERKRWKEKKRKWIFINFSTSQDDYNYENELTIKGEKVFQFSWEQKTFLLFLEWQKSALNNPWRAEAEVFASKLCRVCFSRFFNENFQFISHTFIIRFFIRIALAFKVLLEV